MGRNSIYTHSCFGAEERSHERVQPEMTWKMCRQSWGGGGGEGEGGILAYFTCLGLIPYTQTGGFSKIVKKKLLSLLDRKCKCSACDAVLS